MTLHETSSLIRAHGGDPWNITAEQGVSVLYATINDNNCRVFIPRAGQSPPVNTAAVGFITHVLTDLVAFKGWLASLYHNPSDADDYDQLPFGPSSPDLQ